MMMRLAAVEMRKCVARRIDSHAGLFPVSLYIGFCEVECFGNHGLIANVIDEDQDQSGVQRIALGLFQALMRRDQAGVDIVSIAEVG